MDHASVPLPYDLLKEITDNFSEERIIGSGTYGRVYKGVHKDGKIIAVKMLYDMPGLDDVQFKKEFNNLRSLRHDNIVRLVGYCHEIRKEYVEYNGNMVIADKIHRALCFDYAHKGSLRENIFDESNGHDWHIRYGVIKGICNGLKYLHHELKPPMYHLDIKPANILLDENMLPKVADFGLSRLFGEEQTKITISSLGTLGYLPPEFIEKHVISNKFDIFSLGVVIIKVMTGPLGYSRFGDMPSQEFVEMVHGNWRNRLQTPSMYKPEPYYEQVKTCIEIALRCLETDRHKRPSIMDIIDKMNETETKIRLWPPIEKYSSPASRYLYGLDGITGIRRFEHSELASVTDGFSEDNNLGKGAFGVVYKGSYTDENGKQEVAVKKIEQTTEVAWDFIAELQIIGATRHMNIVKLKGWCCSQNIRNSTGFMGLFRKQMVLFLVFDLPPNGNLSDHLHRRVRIVRWPKRYQIIVDIGSVLRYLHHECDKPILHRHIYPRNILLDNDLNAKLADFGLGRMATLADSVKASAYTDPQCVKRGEVQFSCKSDVYSFGLLLLEIACTGKSRAQILELYRCSAAGTDVTEAAADRRLRGVFDRMEMERVIVLGLRCSHRDSEQRPYMVDAMKFLEEGIELPALVL